MDGIQTHLPVEVLDHIIRSTIPDANYLAYPSSHPTTKTLVSLLTVSKATNHSAKLLLYTHCLYIDTPWRLDSLLKNSLSVPVARINQLYLSPFSGPTIRERKVVEQITELFTLLAPSLKRLIIDMPLRSHYPQEDVKEKLRPILRRGFEQLVNLEEFASVRDPLFLSYWDPAIDREYPDEEWESQLDHWISDCMFVKYTKLRRLALSHGDLGTSLFHSLESLPFLKTFVMTRPIPQFYAMDSWPGRLGMFRHKKINFTIVRATDDVSEAGMRELTERIENLPLDSRPDLWQYLIFLDKDEDEVSTLQKWSLERMLSGGLWSLADLARPDHSSD